MFVILLFIFLLTISCLAPITYQVLTFTFRRSSVLLRVVIAGVAVVVGGVVAFLVLTSSMYGPMPQPSGEPVLAMFIGVAGYALYALALPAVALTIWQVLAPGRTRRGWVWRVPLALALGAYGGLLGLLLFGAVAQLWR